MPQGFLSFADDANNLAKTMLDNEVRRVTINSTKFRALAQPVNAFGANKGQDVAIEKWQKLPKATAPLSEHVSIPLNKPDINEVVITLEEYGNGISSTKKARSVAEYSLSEEERHAVEVNLVESMDDIVGSIAVAADVLFVPTTATAMTTLKGQTAITADSTASANRITLSHLRQIATTLRADNVPFWDGQKYLAVGEPNGVDGLLEDTQAGGFVDILKYERPEMLISGEIGSINYFRLIVETNKLNGSLAGGAAEMVFFADDAIREAMVIPEQILADMWEWDRFGGLVWYALTGFARVWSYDVDTHYRMARIGTNA